MTANYGYDLSIIPGLREVTDAIHDEGAAAGIQIGHCGNMSHKNLWVSLLYPHLPVSISILLRLCVEWKKKELPEMAKAYGNAVNLARKAGFDAVEGACRTRISDQPVPVPYTNHRKDEYGGSLENRMRFMEMVMNEVMKAAGRDMAVLVK